MSQSNLRTVVTFSGPVELVTTKVRCDTRRPMKGHEREGSVSRWFIKYRNGDASIQASNVPADRFLYWPVWFGDTVCPKFRKEVLAEAESKGEEQ